MRTRRARSSVTLVVPSGARRVFASLAFIGSAASAALLLTLAGACSGGGDGGSAAGTGGGSGGAGGVGGGQGGEGLQDFVTSSSSVGAGGMDAGPSCPPVDPSGGATVFASAYGDAQVQSGLSVAADKSGNVLLAGAFQGSMTMGGTTLTSSGKEDGFFAKLSSAGDVLWAKRFGDGQNQSATGIGADANGNVYVTGIFIGTVNFGGGNLTSDTNFFQDVFLAKFAPDGTHIWSKKFGDSNIQYARALAVDASGNVIITGYFQQNVDFGGGVLTASGQSFDAFVAKFDTAGQHLWSRRYGDATDQSANAVTVDASGNVLVAGHAAGSIDFGAGAVTASGTPSAFVAKLDPQGAPIWTKVSGGVGKAAANGVAVSATGSVAVVGSFTGGFDFGAGVLQNPDVDDAYVTVFGPSGAHVLTRKYGDATFQRADGVAFTPNGDVLLTGAFTGTIDFGTGPVTSVDGFDMFLTRLDLSDACPTWLRIFSGAAAQSPQQLRFDGAMGNVLVTGSFGGSVDFGGGPITAAGDDAFLLSVKP